MKTWKWMTGLGLVAAMAGGCGVGLEDSGSDTARDLKNEKLRQEYESVKGTYEGHIRLLSGDRRVPVRLYLFLGEVLGEPLPGDLKPGLRVVLRGRLMQSEFAGDSDNLILTGLYDGVTGAVTLDPDPEISKTSSGCRLGGQDPIGLRARISGANLDGVVLRNGQDWARFEGMMLATREVSSGSVLSEDEEYDRLKRIYEPWIGTYRGVLARRLCGPGGADHEEPIDLLVYVNRQDEGSAGGASCFVPRLMVRTLRTLSGELADVTYRSVNRFSPDRLLPQMQSTRVLGTGSVTSSILDLNGAGGAGMLSGEVSTTGLWGQLKQMNRISREVAIPNNEVELARERRSRTIRRFTGEYHGGVVAYDQRSCELGLTSIGPGKAKECKWWTHLHLYEDDATIEGVRLPVLMAYYTREQLAGGSDPTIGSRLMEVEINIESCKPNLIMQSEGANLPSPIPGVGHMRYSTDWIDGKMRGELIDHRGPQGIMTMARERRP